MEVKINDSEIVVDIDKTVSQDGRISGLRTLTNRKGERVNLAGQKLRFLVIKIKEGGGCSKE